MLLALVIIIKMLSSCESFRVLLSCSYNRGIRLFGDNEELTVLILNKLLQLVINIVTPYLSRYKAISTNTSVSGKQSVQTTSTLSMNPAMVLQRLQKQPSESLSIQDYQLVIKVLTVLSIQIPLASSIDTRLS